MATGREYRNAPQFVLETKFGLLRLVVCDARSVRLTNQEVDRSYNDLVCNRVQVRLIATLERDVATDDATWHVRWQRDHQDKPLVGNEEWHSFDARSTSKPYAVDSSVSIATRDKLKAEILRAFSEWADAHADAFVEAEAAQVYNEITRKVKALAEHQHAMKTIIAEVYDLEAKLERLQTLGLKA